MKISFNDVQMSSNNQGKQDFKVKLFGLRPEETAIVRFLIETTDDFDIYIDHNNIEYDDKKYQKVNCIRSASDPIHKCPLCEANYPVEQIAFFKMLRYDTDENGNITVTPVIWNRSVKSAFINDLIQYLNTYGDLSNMVCSIKRTGSGFNDTKYTISPNLPSARYPDNVYVKDASGFEDYDVLGTLIKDWTAEQMTEFIKTGTNPVHKDSEPQFRQVNNTYVANSPIDDSELPFNGPTSPYISNSQAPTTGSAPSTVSYRSSEPIPTRINNESFTPMSRPQRSYN